MKKDYKILNKCRLCSSKNLRKVFYLKPTPIGDNYLNKVKYQKKYELVIQNCKACNFVQLSCVVNPKKVYGDYLYVTQTSVGLPEHFKDVIDFFFKKKLVSRSSKILEIGCNDGTLLNHLKNKTKLVVGVDPAKKVLKNCKFNKISKFYNFDLSNEIDNKYGKFDLIISNNTLANIDDLSSTFHSISKNLKDNGFLFIESFSLHGILKDNLFDNIYHEHLSYFSIDVLSKYLERFDLQLIDADHLSIKGGSIRILLKKSKEKFKLTKKVKNIILKERKFTKNVKKSFDRIKKINTINKKYINKFFKDNNKSKIFGYGASVGSTTFIYDYNLTKKIKFIFDDEKRRHSKFVPGTNIKVINPKSIKIIKPSFILVFAWRYTNHIVKRNKINNFTKFVRPLPGVMKILK
ncbi:methyltransferase domain-containing protein [Pelagibacterales bacterium SAG-MED44]|nr:methyltransferase domain-containing protein [Pelagibacterales bacterium SAG-MED44]|tara:strand:- start:979 stop:2196 length:1218 start_codon:yes stop_codon:yes gene_type:complete